MATRLCPITIGPHRVTAEHGGHYRIADTVTELGVVGRYRVRLYVRNTGLLLAETYSDATTGAYSFERIAYRYQGYYVIAFDHGENPVNAAIGDYITPELMTS